jgi:3-oxoacyl-[acyl-carrier protein] reductase
MDLGIEGRRAAVAAGSAGLGLGVAHALAAEGVQVAICGRDADRLEAAVEALGVDAAVTPIVADVSTSSGATRFVDAAREALGRLDILVPNAGGPPAGGFADTDLDAYLPALELNLLSTVAMCKAAVPAMAEAGWGRVVAITSGTVRQPAPHLMLSNVARTGATAFLKTLATEVAGQGVTVNSVQPGLHDTARLAHLGVTPEQAARRVPAGFVGDALDFGRLVAFLCSAHARFITGVAVPVDGGSFAGLQ